MCDDLFVQDAKPEPGDASPSACLNCGEKLLGDFCWQCGQETADFHRPLRSLASDFFDNVLSLDSKLLRTIGPLLFKPGRLTREYLEGRRAPYVRPLKLYLLAALLSFGVLAIWPETAVQVVLKQPEPAQEGASVPPPKAEELSSWKDRGFLKALEDPRAFGQALTANLQRAFFLLLPVFALVLKLLYLRRGILYLDHLVFALHYHAFAFVILTALILARANLPRPVAVPIVVTLWLWIFVYLFLALRRVYGDSSLKAGLRFAALMISYGAVFILALIGLMMLTVYRLGS